MTRETRWLARSDRWFRTLLRLYPVDFREEMGEGWLETYRDGARAALRRGGVPSLLRLWLGALVDSLRNGPGERARPAEGWRRGGNWGRDMELTLRRLARAPVFVLTIVGTLTVGLGAFAVVFAVVHNVLLAPLPYDRPGDLYYAWRDYRAIFDLDRGWLSGPDVAALQQAGGVIDDAAGVQRFTATLTLPRGGDPGEVAVMMASPQLFELLGTRPQLGRFFARDEEGAGRAPLVVLTHGLWQRLGGSPTIIGREIRLDGEPYSVIGVTPRDFAFASHSSLGPPLGAEAFVTFNEDLATLEPGAGSFAGLLRAVPGSSPEAVVGAVAAVGSMIDRRDFDSRGLKLYAVSMKPDLVARVRPALAVLGFAGLFLVLVLMVNLGTLLLVRAAQREQEFAVSRALGANPLALARATLLEGGALGLLGGIGASIAALWATRALVALAPLDLPRRDSIAVDAAVVAVVVAVGVLLGLLAAIVPSVWAGRANLSALLRNAAVRGGGGHGRMRRGMVVAQVALSLVLLATGGLVVRSFDRLLRTDPGFDPTGVLTLRVPVPDARYPNDTVANALHERITRELRGIPGVTTVSAALALPLSADANQTSVSFPGAPGNTGSEELDRPLIDWVTARPGYFEALGIRMLAGRDFGDAAPARGEAILDQSLADRFYPRGDALGATIFFADDTLQVVGVVQHARMYDVHSDGRPQVYLRSDQYTRPTLSFVLRTVRDPGALAPEVHAAIRRVDPQLALADMLPMQTIVAESLRQQRASAVLISAFALGALLLAAMGLFGVVAGAVARRRHELAVRLALGADHGRVLRLVMAEGARLILAGLLLGMPGVFLAGNLLRSVLVGVSPSDPLTLVAVAATLGAVALASCYLPARRVAGIQPARSLREE